MSGQSIGQAAARIVGRKRPRDPDRPTDPVRRHSYHEDSPRAQPWLGRRVPSRAEWQAEREWFLAAFDAKRREEQLHLARWREARARARAGGQAPTVEQEPPPNTERLHAEDREVLAYMLHHPGARDHRLYPAQETVAKALGFKLDFVNRSVKRLDAARLLLKTRRMKAKPRAEGEPGNRYVQTSCVYATDWTQLFGRAREVYVRMRTCARNKLGRVQNALKMAAERAATTASATQTPIAWPTDPSLRAALERLHAALPSPSPV